MAIVRWRGDAAALAQETRATPATVEIGDTFILTINGKSVQFVATAATAANVTAGLAAAWNASPVPEHAEITAADTTTYVSLLADTPGVPFVVTAATQNGGAANTQTLALSTVTPSAGPNDWTTAANWSTGAVPANGDDVYVEDSSIDILFGLGQSGVTLASLHIGQSFTGSLGLSRTNAAGYIEYRGQYLAIGATALLVGEGEGAGSGRIQIDTGTTATTINVFNSGSPAEASLETMLWKGTHAANVVNISKGSLGAAVQPGETATIATLRVGYRANAAGDVQARCGAGTTLTAIEQSGGDLTVASGASTIDLAGGALTMLAGGVTTLNLDGGELHYQGTDTLGTVNVGDDAWLDFSRDMRTRTLNNCNLYGRGKLTDPFGTVTFANGVRLVRTTLADVVLDLGTDRTLTPS